MVDWVMNDSDSVVDSNDTTRVNNSNKFYYNGSSDASFSHQQ